MIQWLYTWQTLFAGILAVVAAVGTIWVTHAAAEKQSTATKDAAHSQVAAVREQLKHAQDELTYTKERDTKAQLEAETARRRQQAEQVTAWLRRPIAPDMAIDVFVQNGSQQVAYDVIASLVSLQGAFRHTAIGDERDDRLQYCRLVGNVPPGRVSSRFESMGGGMNLRFGVELAYRDASGRYWLRRGDGTLEEVDKHPLDLYEIARPVTWES